MRDLRSLVLDSVQDDRPISSNLGGEPTATGRRQVADLLTVQSLVSFPIAAGAVLLVWKAIQALFGPGDLADSVVVPALAASLLALGGLLWAWRDLGSGAQRIAAVVIGLLNAGLLTAAAIGIEVEYW